MLVIIAAKSGKGIGAERLRIAFDEFGSHQLVEKRVRHVRAMCGRKYAREIQHVVSAIEPAVPCECDMSEYQ